MNWTLFCALVICFGLIIGNLMLIKHMGKLKLPDELKNKVPATQQPEKPTGDTEEKSEPKD
ncbi:DUF2897 family protein [Alkalimonas collagenimarina]|uniref:DUF2897 family protein n=1 Tax=Alkalimonas collagenimarina TaxID=400390 RepID=A0ABT9H0A2_9GAMM|nr:DUF2897 family protein [Alkalimonas collagenimarina]MDP4536732.1 DUF2897 family protein [Alkalimonas collagenimarina]